MRRTRRSRWSWRPTRWVWWLLIIVPRIPPTAVVWIPPGVHVCLNWTVAIPVVTVVDDACCWNLVPWELFDEVVISIEAATRGGHPDHAKVL